MEAHAEHRQRQGRVVRRLSASLVLAAILLGTTAVGAAADSGSRIDVNVHDDEQGADGQVSTQDKSAKPHKDQQQSTGQQPKTGPQRPEVGKGKAPTAAEVKAYEEALRRYAAALAVCRNELTLYGAAGGFTAADCVRQAGPVPRPPAAKADPDPEDPAPAPPDPAVLAQIAVTRLRIPDPMIKIGPPPEINQWKRAFVGYPLWLWNAEANQLSQSVSLDGVTLTLTARRVATRFDMGEPGAAPVFCRTGTAWTPAVEPGAASPTCGYRYTQASMTAASPGGTYTVTATDRWEVTWTALGQTGVIPLQATAQSQLPVGELQTVRRR